MTANNPDPQRPTLRKSIGRFGYFALGFGTIIGSAWLVVLGDWLRMAGPGGTVLGFVAGGALMCLIAAIYAELCTRMPEAGAEFVFAYRLFGERVGFLVGWFVTLYLVAITAFEAIALPWMLQALLPGLRGDVAYTFLGEQVTTDALAIGVCGIAVITFLNYRDVRLAVTFQSIITYGFILVVLTILAVAAGSGDAGNLQPLFGSSDGRAWWLGAFWIFANTAFFLNGFQAIPQAIEERADGVSARTIARMMIGCVIAGVLFYCTVVLTLSTVKPWQNLATQPLAASAAVESIGTGGTLAKVVLLAGALSLLKTWNSIALMAARILMAQARQALLPKRFAVIHPRYATPGAAVLFVGACTLGGLLLGRAAILPLVSMASICLAFTFVLGCIALLRLRRRGDAGTGGFTLPGGRVAIYIGLAAATGMALVAFFEPFVRSGGRIPLEWMLMSAWAVLGLVFHLLKARVTHAVAHVDRRADH